MKNDFHPLLAPSFPFPSSDARAFVSIPRSPAFAERHCPVRSRTFRDWFSAEFYAEFHIAPSAHTVAAACRHLEARASREPSRLNTPRRVDRRRDNRIFIDLAEIGSSYVEITAEGWNTLTDDPPLFERSLPNCSLPVPESSPAALPHLRALLGLSAPAHTSAFLRCLAWLLTALRADGPFPILILRGPNGCGKSLAARILRGIVDPSTTPLTPIPANSPQLLTLARQNWVLAFDHISHLSPSLADTLCRLSTGIGAAYREPGHDEPVQSWLKRPIILTTTPDFDPPPDLASRALTVTLPDLAPESRRPEPDILVEFGDSLPQILGALCDAVSTALRAPTTTHPHPTRHTTALAWTLAAAPALDATPDEIRHAFDPPPHHPIVNSVRQFLAPTGHWTGTAAALTTVLPLSPQDPGS